MRKLEWMFAVVLLIAAAACGCTGGTIIQPHKISTGGYAKAGKQVIVRFDCGSCHTIPGIRGANGVFGPPLMEFGKRTYIAGNFPNAPGMLVQWIMNPQQMKPGTAMPTMGLTEQEARDAAAYLENLH